MATVEQFQPEERFLLHGIPWETYLELRELPENEHIHMTYQGGMLEMMAPSRSHAQYASLISRLIDAWTEEMGIDIQSCRDMTCRREDLQHGFEPDNCYYVANENAMRQKKELDFTIDPPPDLAVEIDLGGGGLKKLAVYAAFRVPEVWWFDGHTLLVFAFAGQGHYEQQPASVSFPDLPAAEIQRVLAKLGTASETALVRSFRDWVRSQ